jgi:hypothetical protein
MAIGAEDLVGEAGERLMSLEERSVSGRRGRFSEKKNLRRVFDESARASWRQSRALVSLGRKEPNQSLQRNASTGPVSNFKSPARRG